MKASYKSCTEQDTVNIGENFSKELVPGDVVCLTGELGTGKTAFVRGVAKGLGIIGYITSPTFTIVNSYDGNVRMHHFDVYRITCSEEMFEIGFEEYLDDKAVIFIEWAELIEDLIPNTAYWINIIKDPENFDKREIEIKR